MTQDNPYKVKPGLLSEVPSPTLEEDFVVENKRSFPRHQPAQSTQPTPFGATSPTAPEEQSRANTDSRYQSVGLPSNFYFYPFDTLSIRPFELAELKKIWRAYTQKEFKAIVEAINACIDQDAQLLTEDDFRFLMYWQRTNSYKSSTYTVPLECKDKAHIKRVERGELDPETLITKQLVKSSTVDIQELNTDAVNAFILKVHADYGIYLYPTTVGDIVTAMDTRDLDPEEDFMMKYASCVSRVHGDTLSKRIALLESARLPPQFMEDVEFFTDLAAHGVKETTNFKCKVCGVEQSAELRVSAVTFFPHVFGGRNSQS
jgi:hypothetical protein